MNLSSSYHDTVNLGEWENVVCTDEHPYVCSHEQTQQFSADNYPTWNLMPGFNIKFNSHAGGWSLRRP